MEYLFLLLLGKFRKLFLASSGTIVPLYFFTFFFFFCGLSTHFGRVLCWDGGPAPTLALHIFCFVREWAGVSGRWSCSHPCPVVFVWATLHLGNRVCVSGWWSCSDPCPCGLHLGNRVCVSGRWSCSDPCLCGVWGTGFACRDGGPARPLFVWRLGYRVCVSGRWSHSRCFVV